MAKTTTAGKGSGVRRRFKGKMVRPNGEPRSQHIDKLNAPVTYTCGDTEVKAVGTKHVLGKYKVQAPLKAWQRHGIWRSA